MPGAVGDPQPPTLLGGMHKVCPLWSPPHPVPERSWAGGQDLGGPREGGGGTCPCSPQAGEAAGTFSLVCFNLAIFLLSFHPILTSVGGWGGKRGDKLWVSEFSGCTGRGSGPPPPQPQPPWVCCSQPPQDLELPQNTTRDPPNAGGGGTTPPVVASCLKFG